MKTFILLIDLYLQKCTRVFYQRVSYSMYKQTREKFCSWICQKIRHHCCWLALRASLLVLVSAPSIINVWITCWHHFQNHTKKTHWELIISMSNKDVFQLHKNLHKFKSSALVQFHTGCTGLNWFLMLIKVSNIKLQCCCKFIWETPCHILFQCKLKNH